LLLSNVPVHPNVVNGSYAALCDIKDSTGKAMTTDDVCLVNIAEKVSSLTSSKHCCVSQCIICVTEIADLNGVVV
jgi:hypothetical protein